MAGNKRWSEKDMNTLRREYGWTDLEALATKLGRSVDAVQWKASKEGIAYTREVNMMEYKTISRQLERMIEEIETMKKDIKLIVSHIPTQKSK